MRSLIALTLAAGLAQASGPESICKPFQDEMAADIQQLNELIVYCEEPGHGRERCKESMREALLIADLMRIRASVLDSCADLGVDSLDLKVAGENVTARYYTLLHRVMAGGKR